MRALQISGRPGSGELTGYADRRAYVQANTPLDFAHPIAIVNYVIPQQLTTLFWDIDVGNFDPTGYPDYTIARVLEFGDEQAIAWMKETFSEAEIKRVIRTERRLSKKSANFWALIYGIASQEVAALRG